MPLENLRVFVMYNFTNDEWYIVSIFINIKFLPFFIFYSNAANFLEHL